MGDKEKPAKPAKKVNFQKKCSYCGRILHHPGTVGRHERLCKFRKELARQTRPPGESQTTRNAREQKERGEFERERVEERRGKVLHMLAANVPVERIARELGVTASTAWEDVNILKQRYLDKLKSEPPVSRIVDELIIADKMVGEMRSDFFRHKSAENPGARSQAGRLWIDSWDKVMGRKQEFGVLPKRPEQIQVLGGKDFTTMSAEDLEKERDVILGKLGLLKRKKRELEHKAERQEGMIEVDPEGESEDGTPEQVQAEGPEPDAEAGQGTEGAT